VDAPGQLQLSEFIKLVPGQYRLRFPARLIRGLSKGWKLEDILAQS
jgi:hypothetical protein